MNRYTRAQKLLLAIELPFGLMIVILNVASAFGASEPAKDLFVLVGMCAFLIGIGWATWTWVRKPRS